MLAQLIEEIKEYQGELVPNFRRCRHCNDQPGCFKRHSARKRIFLVIVCRLVHTITTSLIRFKCPLCNATFTHYPPFALPYKRYTRQSIANRCRSFLDNHNLSYRQSVKDDNGMPLCYDIESDPKADGRQLAHSTVWRWGSTLGAFRKTVRKALDLIKQKNPASAIFHSLANLHVAQNKFRSNARLAILKTCRQLFLVEEQFNAVLEESIFPALATKCGWT